VARARTRQQLNDALLDVHRAAWPILRPFVVRRLEQRRVRGPDGTVADAEDILNLLLQRVAASARSFQGAAEAQAEAWLRTMAKRLVFDETKKALRNRPLWQAVERVVNDLGYQRFNPRTSEKEPDDVAEA
jgi:DNA-directed RNA polymerase specialized sigma24 family protein